MSNGRKRKAPRIPRDWQAHIIAQATEIRRLDRELKSAEDQVASNQEELARLRHLVANPDFNLPAALAIVRERDEWKTNYELVQRKLSEIEARLPKIGEPYLVDDDGFPVSIIPRPVPVRYEPVCPRPRESWLQRFNAWMAKPLW